MEQRQDDFAEADIRITYTGEKLESHLIDVEDFAQSIDGASRLLKEINRTIYGCEFLVKTRLRNVEPNCVSADILVSLQQAADAIHFLAYNPVAIFLEDILKLAGFCGIPPSIYYAIKIIRNKLIHRVEKSSSDDVTLILDDSSEITIPRNVYDVLSNRLVREYLKKHTQILYRERVETIEYVSKFDGTHTPKTVITREYANVFDRPFEKTLSDKEFDIVAELDRPSYYRATRGWKLVQDGKIVPYPLVIEDKDFLDDVASGDISVFKGQKFKIRLLEKQTNSQKNPTYRALFVTPV